MIADYRVLILTVFTAVTIFGQDLGGPTGTVKSSTNLIVADILTSSVIVSTFVQV